MYWQESYQSRSHIAVQRSSAGACDPLMVKINLDRSRSIPVEGDARGIRNAALSIHESARASAPTPVIACRVTREDERRPSLNQLDYP